MKRYFMMYESDRIICGNSDHTYGYASTVKTAKGYIRKCRNILAEENPRNFRVYDWMTDNEEAEIIYQED